jgi:hypothetical protein
MVHRRWMVRVTFVVLFTLLGQLLPPAPAFAQIDQPLPGVFPPPPEPTLVRRMMGWADQQQLRHQTIV